MIIVRTVRRDIAQYNKDEEAVGTLSPYEFSLFEEKKNSTIG